MRGIARQLHPGGRRVQPVRDIAQRGAHGLSEFAKDIHPDGLSPLQRRACSLSAKRSVMPAI